MAERYTHKSLTDVEDAAAKFGLSESQESRFANADLETEQTGLSLHRIKPGKRQGFGHRHDEVEEVYVVVTASGPTSRTSTCASARTPTAPSGSRSAPTSTRPSARTRLSSSCSRSTTHPR